MRTDNVFSIPERLLLFSPRCRALAIRTVASRRYSTSSTYLVAWSVRLGTPQESDLCTRLPRPSHSVPPQEEHRLTLLNMTTGDLDNLFDDEDGGEWAQETDTGSGNNNSDNGRSAPQSDPDRSAAEGSGSVTPARHENELTGDGETPPMPLAGSTVEASGSYPVRGGRHDAAEPSRMRKSSFSRTEERRASGINTADPEKKCDESGVGRDSGGDSGRGEEKLENKASEAAGGHGGERGAEAPAGEKEPSWDEVEEHGGEQRRDSGDGQRPRPKRNGPIVMNCSQVRVACAVVRLLSVTRLSLIGSRGLSSDGTPERPHQQQCFSETPYIYMCISCFDFPTIPALAAASSGKNWCAQSLFTLAAR